MIGEFQTVTILRIYVGEDIFLNEKPLYKAILQEARRLHLAGGTVYRCTEGFSSETRGMGKRLLVNLTDPSNLPIVLEIVDSREHLELLFPFLDKHLNRGMATMTEANVLLTPYVKERIEAISRFEEEQYKK